MVGAEERNIPRLATGVFSADAPKDMSSRRAFLRRVSAVAVIWYAALCLMSALLADFAMSRVTDSWYAISGEFGPYDCLLFSFAEDRRTRGQVFISEKFLNNT
jgi:hypothetical protein